MQENPALSKPYDLSRRIADAISSADEEDPTGRYEALMVEASSMLVAMDSELATAKARLAYANEQADIEVRAMHLAEWAKRKASPALGETANEWSLRTSGTTREERGALIAEACAPLEAAALALTAGITQAARTVIDPRNGDVIRVMVTRFKKGTLEHRKALVDLSVAPVADAHPPAATVISCSADRFQILGALARDALQVKPCDWGTGERGIMRTAADIFERLGAGETIVADKETP